MIKVYSTSDCHYCDLVKDFLKENNQEFEEVIISSGNDNMQKLRDKGFIGVPVTEIDDEFISGFNKEAILKALNLKEE